MIPTSNLTTSCSFEPSFPTPIPVTTAYFCPTLTTLSFNLTTSCSSEPSFPKPIPVSTSYTCPTLTTSCSFEPSFPTPIPVTTSYFCPTLTTMSSNLTTSCGSEPYSYLMMSFFVLPPDIIICNRNTDQHTYCSEWFGIHQGGCSYIAI